MLLSSFVTVSELAKNGLELMLNDMEIGGELITGGTHVFDSNTFTMETAAVLMALANIAPDRPEYFPRGKWATIQAMEEQFRAGLIPIEWRKTHE